MRSCVRKKVVQQPQWRCIIFWLLLVRSCQTFTPSRGCPQKRHSCFCPQQPPLVDLSSWASRPLQASSEGTATQETKPAEDENPSASVQRVYDTFKWTNPYDDIVYNINYRVEGDKNSPPILLIHGFGANVNHFRYQFPALAKNYRVYAVDLLGFGASDKPASDDYSMELFTTLLGDFVTAMQQQDFKTSPAWIVAGNSIGGLASLMLAAEAQQETQSSKDSKEESKKHLPPIDRVVLFNCSGGMTGFRYEDVPWFLRPILYFVQNVVIRGPIGPAFFANFRSPANVQSILSEQGVYGDTTNVDDELLEILLAPADDAGACDVFLRVFGGPPGPTPEAILPTLACPILALWGSADPWTPLEAGMHPATGLESFYFVDDNNKPADFFQLEVLDGAGHCPHDECPDQVNARMLAWLDKMKGRYSSAGAVA